MSPGHATDGLIEKENFAVDAVSGDFFPAPTVNKPLIEEMYSHRYVAKGSWD